MSFRATEANATREPTTTGTAPVRAYLVLSGGRYTVSTTGPADAFLGDAGGGRVDIDAAATENANSALLFKHGTRFRIV